MNCYVEGCKVLIVMNAKVGKEMFYACFQHMDSLVEKMWRTK